MTSPADAFVDIVGKQHVLTDPDLTAGYLTDWTGRFRVSTGWVVRPADTAQAAAVVTRAAELGVALVPRGGGTGLVGGSVPLSGEGVLSLERLTGRVEVDAAAGQVVADAGVTIGAVQAAAKAAGWQYGVDLAARDSATVGGTVATNAGGLRVLRYGDTRAQVIGMEAVLGDGSVVSHLDGPARDNTGFHLPGLLTGSEGTLGVVTAARLRLHPPVTSRVVALLGFTDLATAVSAVGPLRSTVAGLSALEFFLAPGLDLVRRHTGLPAPLGAEYPAYLLVETEAGVDSLASAVAALAGLGDAAVAEDPAGVAGLWAYRERHTEAIATLGPVVKLDVTLPLSALADFLAELPALAARFSSGARVWLFGHIGDGNVHANITGVGADAHPIEDAVLRRVARVGGSIATEHGIGTAKKEWLHLVRSPAEIAAFRAIKAALDPAGILNPHAVLP